jgi:tRNA uridine 5-carbamoylmethylation protein Kti12
VFEDLAGRFEPPDSRNRWDSPLFTVRPALQDAESITRSLAEVVGAMLEGAGRRAAAGAAVGGPGEGDAGGEEGAS